MQWRIQDFLLGGADPLGGGANLRCVHFSAKTYAKMKEIDPVGGRAQAAPPPDPPMYCKMSDVKVLEIKYYTKFNRPCLTLINCLIDKRKTVLCAYRLDPPIECCSTATCLFSTYRLDPPREFCSTATC